MALIVTNCPACSHPTRVPDDRGRIRVVCPSCDHRWLYPIVIEYTSIAMRCSVSGQPFQINFMRKPGAFFTIVNVALTGPNSSAVVPFQQIPVRQSAALPTQEFTSNDFNYYGFRCPSCAVLGTNHPNPYVYFQCNSCGQLVCNGSTRSMGDGSYKFHCICGCISQVGTTETLTISGTMRRESIEPISRPRLASEPAPAPLKGPARLLTGTASAKLLR